MANNSNEAYRLSHSFFMGKKFQNDQRLIFHKKLLKPINVDKWKSLSHFQIKGFRMWKSPFIENYFLNNNTKDNDIDFSIIINETNIIKIPSFMFFNLDNDYLINKIISSLTPFIVHEQDYLFIKLEKNVYFFSILKENLSIKFGKEFCDRFGFFENFEYKKKEVNNDGYYIFSEKKFRDKTCNHIGVSVNFGYNKMISSYEIIGILSCDSIPLMGFFDFNIVQRPLFMNIKFESIYEIEVQFINLADGQVLKMLPSNSLDHELFISMAFSEI